jgi:hypothetical protein
MTCLRRLATSVLFAAVANAQGIFDVKAYGAAGDGKTDDTAAILKALSAADQAKGILHFPIGTFLISKTITIPRHNNIVQFQIRGECAHEVSSSAGMPCSVLKTSGNFTALQSTRLTRMLQRCNAKASQLVCEDASFSSADRGKPIEIMGAGSRVEGTTYARSLLTSVAEVMGPDQVRTADAVKTSSNSAVAYLGPDSLEHWSQYLSISDLYIQGPQMTGASRSPSVGLDLNGVQFFRGNNLHVEGFGTCLRIVNGSEITFQGRTLLQNCYDGVHLQRVNNTDLQATFDNLVTVNNQRNVVLDNVRSVWVKAGENIAYGKPLGRTPLSRIYIQNAANSAAHFDNYVGEDDEPVPFVSVDEAGISMLTFDRGNFETIDAKSVLIDIAGEFDAVAVRNSAFPRATGDHAPIVRLRSQSSTSQLLRTNTLEITGNSPSWFDFFVRDDRRIRNPQTDFVPASWQNANPSPSMDSPNPRLSILGKSSFVNDGQGKTRLVFSSGAQENYVTIQFPRPLKGATRVFVTFLVDDNNSKTVPRINSVGGLSGGNPADWQPIATSVLGMWESNGRTLTKYGVTIGILAQSKAITSVQIGNIFGGAKGSGGLQTLNIWLDTREVGPLR